MQKGLARKGVARMMTPCLILRAETLLRDKQWSHQQIYGACTQEDGKKNSVMKAFIGTSNRSNIRAERPI
jgi:hypothetical protein